MFHVVLLTVLGLLTEPEEDGPHITLSTRVHALVREGGTTQIVPPTDTSVYDLGVPDSVDLEDPAQRRALARADQDARELRLVDPDNPHVPDLKKVRQQMASASPRQRTLAARDPRLRVEMVQREGGTTLTEAAVARGLRWLAQHQNHDGSWSLDRFHRVEGCDCRDRGSLESETAATALALLPFLGAGQTHLSGIYRDQVAQGLRWLHPEPRADGDLRGSPGQYPGMYAQGQAAIVLCEAFFMTGDEALRGPGPARDRLHRRRPVSGRRVAVLSASRDSEQARGHERRGVAVDGASERSGSRALRARSNAGERRPLSGHRAARRRRYLLPMSRAKTPRLR